MGAPVNWFEIIAQDPKKIREFYGKAFNWTFGDLGDDGGDLEYSTIEPGSRDGGAIGGIAKASEFYGPAGTRIFCVVEDLQGTLDKIVSLGGKVVMPVTEIPGTVYMALYSDPEGNINAIFKPFPMQDE